LLLFHHLLLLKLLGKVAVFLTTAPVKVSLDEFLQNLQPLNYDVFKDALTLFHTDSCLLFGQLLFFPLLAKPSEQPFFIIFESPPRHIRAERIRFVDLLGQTLLRGSCFRPDHPV